MDVVNAFPEELFFIKEDKALFHRLRIEGMCKFLCNIVLHNHY